MSGTPGSDLDKFKWLELHYTDLAGYLRSVTIAAEDLRDNVDVTGFDGSSVEGFTDISDSDLTLRPDLSTLAEIPWLEATGRVISTIYKNGARYERDPRYIAERTEKLLGEQGLEARIGPEIEFHIVDKLYLSVDQPQRGLCYRIVSSEHPGSGSYFEKTKKAYHTPAPFDKVYGLRLELAEVLRKYFRVHVEVHHHEVASGGQIEIDFRYGGVVSASDGVITVKYVARNITARHGYTAIFMPKPFAGDNGNGMHVHISIWERRGNGFRNLFYDPSDGYAELSQYARYFIGGLLEHGRALAAIVAPTVNSYRRLIPGYEAPVYLVWGRSNRSAAIRVPFYGRGAEKSKRIEFRPPDPSANPYLAFTAIIAAGLDGVRKKIEPGDPIDRNVYTMSEAEKKRLGIKELPRSLEEALDELESDNEFLRPYIPSSVLEAYIELKRREARELKGYPSPMEIYTYLSL
ncbi:type I glutamate--ammonia ligase [Hyperthermus butylicus]